VRGAKLARAGAGRPQGAGGTRLPAAGAAGGVVLPPRGHPPEARVVTASASAGRPAIGVSGPENTTSLRAAARRLVVLIPAVQRLRMTPVSCHTTLDGAVEMVPTGTRMAVGSGRGCAQAS